MLVTEALNHTLKTCVVKKTILFNTPYYPKNLVKIQNKIKIGELVLKTKNNYKPLITTNFINIYAST